MNIKSQFFIVSLLIISACNSEIIYKDTKAFMSDYFIKLKNNNYETVYTMYDKKYFPETWMEQLKRKENLFGSFVKSELVETTLNQDILDKTTVVLTYKLHYLNGNTKETFTLMKTDGNYKIVGHNISSDMM